MSKYLEQNKQDVKKYIEEHADELKRLSVDDIRKRFDDMYLVDLISFAKPDQHFENKKDAKKLFIEEGADIFNEMFKKEGITKFITKEDAKDRFFKSDWHWLDKIVRIWEMPSAIRSEIDTFIASLREENASMASLSSFMPNPEEGNIIPQMDNVVDNNVENVTELAEESTEVASEEVDMEEKHKE